MIGISCVNAKRGCLGLGVTAAALALVAACSSSLDSTFLDCWKARGADVSPFLEEAENSSHVEALPVAPEAGQVITSLAADLGPASLSDEPAAKDRVTKPLRADDR